jgi:LDH2 family malate/lactate/ureidoglycolate dehydrogenase
MIASENFSADVIRAQIEAILRAWGMSEEKLRLTAEVMVETDLRGIDSHGISMLTQYAQMQKAGQIALQAEPRIVRQSASTALIDGGAGLGHPAALMGMSLAIEKALAHDGGGTWIDRRRVVDDTRDLRRADEWGRTRARHQSDCRRSTGWSASEHLR